MLYEIEKIGGSKPWVAEIVGNKDPKFGLERKFVNGIADYSRANKPRTRGVYFGFSLEEGKIYEIKGGNTWGSSEKRRFVRIVGDEIESIELADVISQFA